MLRMPEEMRAELSKPYGILLTGDLDSNVRDVLTLIKRERPPRVVIVGDYVLTGFVKSGYMPSLGIYDRKTKRSPFPLNLKHTETVLNPPGHISDQAVLTIKRLLSSTESSILYVEGEEDLLAIPAILNSPEGSFVIYGLPEKGMILIRVEKNVKKKISEILERFDRVP